MISLQKNVIDMETELKASWSKIPDQRLSLTEDGIAYDGTPFSQVAHSEQLRIAIRIAMALNPKLRVIFISDYSLLDSESKETIRKMSEDEDYQIWAESVDTGEFGFYIEGGLVAKEQKQETTGLIEQAKIIEEHIHKEEGLSDPRD